MHVPTAEDIAAMRADGSLMDYLKFLTSQAARPVPKPRPVSASLAVVSEPVYRIAHPGGWPLGTAVSGPTPPPDVCTCARCGSNPNTTHRPQEGAAA